MNQCNWDMITERKEDWSGSYIIHDGRLRAGYARVATYKDGLEEDDKNT